MLYTKFRESAGRFIPPGAASPSQPLQPKNRLLAVHGKHLLPLLQLKHP